VIWDANLGSEIFLDLHLPAQLSPYFTKRQLVVCMDEAVQSNDMEILSVLL
jgi:hypothetical protein